MRFTNIATVLGAVSAWWDNGHLLTARIAYDVLEKESPETIEAVNQILMPLRSSDPSWTTSESAEHGVVECATWADEIKSKGGNWQSNWHFVDQPLMPEGKTLDDYPKFKLEEHNVTVIVPNLIAWLKDEPGHEDGFAYQTIMNHTYKEHTDETGKSTAMRCPTH